MYLLNDAKLITKKTNKEIELQQKLNEELNNKRILQSFFESSIQQICQKFNLTYNKNSNTLYFRQNKDLYRFMEKCINTMLRPEFNKIGIILDDDVTIKSLNPRYPFVDLNKSKIEDINNE